MKPDSLTAFLLFFSIITSPGANSQKIDSTSLTMNSRLSFYSFEKKRRNASCIFLLTFSLEGLSILPLQLTMDTAVHGRRMHVRKEDFTDALLILNLPAVEVIKSEHLCQYYGSNLKYHYFANLIYKTKI